MEPWAEWVVAMAPDFRAGSAQADYIVRELEDGKAGSLFPTLVMHSDCDGEWSPPDCDKLKKCPEIECEAGAKG